MANFELTVESEAFKKHGIVPSFDENLYGELLDEFAPGTQGLMVNVKPHINYGLGPFREGLRMHIAMIASDYASFVQQGTRGQYNSDDQNQTIDVFASHDIDVTNKILLHETRHHIDYCSGELEKGRQWAEQTERKVLRRVAKASVLAGLAVGGCVEAGTGDEFTAGFMTVSTGVISITGSLALARSISYRRSPHEIAARSFAADTNILERYGSIIRYSKLV